MICSVELSPSGDTPNPRSFHSCTSVGNHIYIHGGMNKLRTVLDNFYCYDSQENKFEKLSSSIVISKPSKTIDTNGIAFMRFCNSPALSHHASVTFKNRYVFQIGGWNGRRRSSDIFVFDTKERFWFQMPISGEVPAGLSSHTATLISEKEILIVGREGGIHTQRRSGNAFRFNICTGQYKEGEFRVSSRSGHTANLIRWGSNSVYSLLVYSGRKSGAQFDVVGSWKAKPRQEAITDDCVLRNMIDHLQEPQKCQEPEGRQHSRSLPVGDRYLVFYGGEMWRGARENVTAELFVFDCKNISWYKPLVHAELPKAVGHSFVQTQDGKVFIFGGTNGSTISNKMFTLMFP